MSNQVKLVIESTIKKLNMKIGALRINTPPVLTNAEAKRLKDNIENIIRVEIYNAFRSVPASDTTKLRHKLSLLFHPDKMHTALPDLYEKLEDINSSEYIYNLRDYPQKIVNEMANSHQFTDDKGIFRSWLDAVDTHLAQHHRYPEVLKKTIDNFLTILDYALVGAYYTNTFFFIVCSEQFLMLYSSIVLTALLELSILYIYTGRMDFFEDKDSFLTSLSNICNLLAHLFTDKIVDPSFVKISLRMLQIALAPVVLLLDLYRQIGKAITLASLYVLAVPAVGVKLVVTMLFSLPFYLIDGFDYLHEKWSIPSNPTPKNENVSEKLNIMGMFASSSTNYESIRTESYDGKDEEVAEIYQFASIG